MADGYRSYTRDWLLALAICLAVAVGVAAGWRPLSRLENLTYDATISLTHRNGSVAEELVLVEIDPESEEKIGKWPWPRSELAAGVDSVLEDGAAAVGLLWPLTDAQSRRGLQELEALSRYLAESPVRGRMPSQYRALSERIAAVRRRLDVDGQLAAVMEGAGRVYLPMRFATGEDAASAAAGDGLPAYLREHRIENRRPPRPVAFKGPALPPQIESLMRHSRPLPDLGAPVPPLELFARRAEGIGYLNRFPAGDGVVRSEPLVLLYRDEYYPSLSLLLASRALGLSPDEIVVEPTQGISLGDRFVPTDRRMRLRAGFRNGSPEQPAFESYSFHQVDDEVLNGRFAGKVVLIGLSPAVGGRTWPTPVADDASEIEVTANLVQSMLNQDYYQRPPWAMWGEWGALAAAALVCVVVVPFAPVVLSVVLALLLALGLLSGSIYLMIGERLWVQATVPALMTLLVTGIVSVRRTIRAKEHAQMIRAAETDRQLGLTYQSQGQLDLAMDKFRALPVDDTVLELIYNLARDFERKRQFNKALSAYDYIRKYRPRFRDVAVRRRRALELEQAVHLQGRRRTGDTDTLLMSGIGEKPTLGRYTIEKHLGRGAMGAVYQGRDPRINRVVAIKTVALTEEFAEDEVEEVRRRFFHEAEVAGRLNHPNIVTIYDAGEDQDLAYIAMEYLEGEDMRRYARKENRLALNKTMEIVAQIATALDYAHQQGVVHRDIKPSNVILDAKTGQVKVADFGIAHIATGTKTHTGTILGTPPYMSPEQLAGRRVDGRADIFSLGVLLFELVAGRRPFEGDSVETVMYRIANVKHPSITRFRRNVPECLQNILDKSLQKDPAKRYQTAGGMRTALLRCMQGSQTGTGNKAGSRSR